MRSCVRARARAAHGTWRTRAPVSRRLSLPSVPFCARNKLTRVFIHGFTRTTAAQRDHRQDRGSKQKQIFWVASGMRSTGESLPPFSPTRFAGTRSHAASERTRRAENSITSSEGKRNKNSSGRKTCKGARRLPFSVRSINRSNLDEEGSRIQDEITGETRRDGRR